MNTIQTKGSDGRRGAYGLICLAWLLYTVSYLGKVNYSANITQIMDFYRVSRAEAGTVPSFFFFAYGIGQVLNGLLCKKYNIKWVIFGSMLASAGINLAIGITADFGIIKWLWMLNGLALSVLWPTLVRLLTEALPQRDLGSSGVIMGTTVAAGTLAIYGLSALYVLWGRFKLAFYTAAAVDAAVALLWLMLYQRTVQRASAARGAEIASAEQGAEVKSGGTGREKATVYLTVCVLCFYAIVVNLTKDGLTTWVPSILKESFAVSDALSILLTLLLPIVAIFGNATALAMHRKIPDYATHCALVFVLSGGLVYMIIAGISHGQMAVTLLGLVLVSFLASGLNSLITGIFPMFMRGKVNAGLFAGVLNGFCYVGSTVSAYGLGAVADRLGWLAVFWLLIGCCALTVLVFGAYRIAVAVGQKKQQRSA